MRPGSKHPHPIYNQICDIPYPINDLTKNLKPFYDLQYNPLIITLFWTYVIITSSSLVKTNVKLL